MGGPHLTAVETAQRHARIIAMKLAGETWESIAADVGMSERGARTAYYNWRDSDRLDLVRLANDSPIDFIHEHIAGFQMIRRQLHNVADNAINESARVGALKAAADMRVRELDLLQAVGMLPRNLGRFNLEIDLRFVESELVRLIDGLAISDAERQEFVGSIVDALNPGARIAAAARAQDTLELEPAPAE